MLEYTFWSDLSGIFPLPSANGGSEGLDRIFVGGLPYYFTEVQMRELLQAFGYDCHGYIYFRVNSSVFWKNFTWFSTMLIDLLYKHKPEYMWWYHLTHCSPLRNFDIVRDKDTGNSKGYGFCIYQVKKVVLQNIDLNDNLLFKCFWGIW